MESIEAREKQTLPGEGTRPGPVFQPETDIVENATGYVIYADLPGVDDRSVAIRLENGHLTIDAELAITPDPEWTPIHTEYELGSYHREFRVSDAIDTTGVSAKMRRGVLELHLPKAAQQQARSIPVRAG